MIIRPTRVIITPSCGTDPNGYWPRRHKAEQQDGTLEGESVIVSIFPRSTETCWWRQNYRRNLIAIELGLYGVLRVLQRRGCFKWQGGLNAMFQQNYSNLHLTIWEINKIVFFFHDDTITSPNKP